ncbi:MAG: porphobilinogen synthase [Myxococcales bacterium]|nr:porphobilinogen synthase [Myxococcales bacterium]
MQYPDYRPRRLRRSENLRRMIQETTLSPADFVYPVFLVAGTGVKKEISSMPGQYNLSVDMAVEMAEEAYGLGIPSVILFAIPEAKDSVGAQAWNDKGIVQQAIRAIKRKIPNMVVIADACFCEYTDHGHCGVLTKGVLDNDASLENLQRVALSYAKAGVDIVAPSGMLDGFVGATREGLDSEAYDQVGIMAYSAKYASAYYDSFRDAADCAPLSGDRRGYQMDPANGREALREVTLDIAEGADIVMVKPALAYLDIIHSIASEVDLPIAAYNVSGEYAMVKAAALNGWADYDRVMMENLLAMKRAGSDMMLTYHALDAAKLLGG